MPVVSLAPSADFSVQFTPVGAVSNYLCVTQGSTSLYNEAAAAVGLRDLFDYVDLEVAATGVSQVDLVLQVRVLASSGLFKMKPVWRLATGEELLGTEVTLTLLPPPPYPEQFDFPFQTIPFPSLACPDGGSWSVAKTNGTKFGYQITAASSSVPLQVNFCRPAVTYSAVPAITLPVPSIDTALARASEATSGVLRTASLTLPVARAAQIEAALARMVSLDVSLAIAAESEVTMELGP